MLSDVVPFSTIGVMSENVSVIQHQYMIYIWVLRGFMYKNLLKFSKKGGTLRV